MASTAATNIQPRYATAWRGPVSGKLREPKISVGMKLKASIQRKPRRGFCVPTNQTARMGPVQAPTASEKKPRAKREATIQAMICDMRLGSTSWTVGAEWTAVDILFSFDCALCFLARRLRTCWAG